MVDAVVSYAIGALSEFVTQQVKIRKGVKDDIEWLKKELDYLLISVNEAEALQGLAYIRPWINEVKDVANEAVIILERFSIQQEENTAPEQGVLDRVQGFICICKKEANLYDIGDDIKSLKAKISEIKDRRDEYHIMDKIIVTQTAQQRKRTLLKEASFDHEKDVIGFKDDVETLLAQLVKSNPSLSLISVHGMGGLGKSTLANKLYYSKELDHFKLRGWVCVSEDYDIAHVLRKIINSFTGQTIASLQEMEEMDLMRHLRTILLKCDHYLAVIDDLWNIEVWKKIKNAFPDEKNGGRIIITTRNKLVAEGVDVTCFVHELRFLRKDESWQLFRKGAEPTPNLERLGKEMVGKCGGLPLAIVILSGLLSQTKSNTFWSDVNAYLWRKLQGESSEIQEILKLSYDGLSFQLRQCFLYLARYPEDHIIHVSKLKLLWIAEGFISEADEKQGVNMEDVAEDYVNELINRNMVQMVTKIVGRPVYECRVHDLVRDLVIQKASEQKIFGIFDSSKQHPNPIHLLQGQPRHVIYNGIGKYLKLLGPNSDNLKLRSLALSASDRHRFRLGIEEIKLMCTRFKNLKVLDMTSVSNPGVIIPDEIGDLNLLKFLGLMGGGSMGKPIAIPPSIGKLKRLQTICGWKFYIFSSEYEFPKEICKLKELRHLDFFHSDTRGYLNIGGDQTKLQTIKSIMYKEWFHIDTINLTNLHTLYIQGGGGAEEGECSLESIANLTSLRTLVLLFLDSVITTLQPLSSCKQLKRFTTMTKIKDTAELIFLPDSVTELQLQYTEFAEDPMPTLGSLSNLTVLYLEPDAYVGDKMVCSSDAFPSLRILKLNGLANLKEFEVDDRCLPCLKAFESDCSYYGIKIPQRIKSLPPPPDFFTYLY